MPRLKSILTAEYPALANRPLNSSLSSKKIFTKLNIKPSDWKKGIKKTLSILKKESYI